MAVDGLTSKRSSFGPEETLKRLEAEVKAKGLTLFAHVRSTCRFGRLTC